MEQSGRSADGMFSVGLHSNEYKAAADDSGSQCMERYRSALNRPEDIQKPIWGRLRRYGLRFLLYYDIGCYLGLGPMGGTTAMEVVRRLDLLNKK
ncbi:hypothetical protein TWF481_003707 [Arthrobotrys musiformis]|uniref:Uncharacterized protein n=1 Tax=Arthrobotrys musiformis TaxID=47236 RepID=A0AAV9WHB1_9PEZI